jgi:hypothetical protein
MKPSISHVIALTRRGDAAYIYFMAGVKSIRKKRFAVGDTGRFLELFLYTAKTGTAVYCPLPPFVMEALNAIPASTYFFWTGLSKPKSAVGDWQRSLKRLLILAGVPEDTPIVSVTRSPSNCCSPACRSSAFPSCSAIPARESRRSTTQLGFARARSN